MLFKLKVKKMNLAMNLSADKTKKRKAPQP